MGSFEEFQERMFPEEKTQVSDYASENFVKSSRVLYESDILNFQDAGMVDAHYAEVWKRNLAQYGKICDHVGDDVLILGSTERRIQSLDDLVTLPLSGWNVFSIVGKAGCGKSVLGSFLAEQMYYFTSTPTLFHDRANEFFYHKYSQKNPVILKNLYSLGFEAMGMREVSKDHPGGLLTISPYFLNMPYADVQWGISLEDLYALGTVGGKTMFQKFLGADMATDDVSDAYLRTIKELYRHQPHSFDEIMQELDKYNERLHEEKKASNISRSLSLFLEDLHDEGIFIRGQSIDIAEILSNHINVDFITVKGAVDNHELECYESYLASLVYECSKPFAYRGFPNICEVFEEADIIFRSRNATLKKLLTDKILKQRKEGNSAMFVTQDVTFFPDYLLLNSKAILTTKPTSDKAMTQIAMKNPTEDVAYRLQMLDEPEKPLMPQWAVITEYGMETFYTLGSFGATHEVKQRQA